MRSDAVDDDSQRLVQAHLRIGQSDLAQQRDHLLDRSREERQEGVAVKVPSIALCETPRRRKSNGGIGRRVAADEVDEKGVDFGPSRLREVFADPIADEPGDPSTDDAVAARRSVSEEIKE